MPVCRSGQRQVHEVDILSQLDMQRGEWYKASIVQQSQYNLYRLDNFEIARIDLDTNQINAISDSARDGQIIDVNRSILLIVWM